MAEMNFDVAVVGAGPAGSYAAERLALGGAKVFLFDGRDPASAKPCGGGVTTKALKRWPFVCEAGGRLVSSVEMYSPEGRRVRLELAEPFFIYSRRALDDYLRDRARRAGARVITEKVRLEERKRTDETWRLRARNGSGWSARVVISADGANSPIAKRFAGPIPNSEMEVAFGYRLPLGAVSEARTVIAFLPGWAGYTWAFPRLDHVSFGIATAQDTFAHKALDEFLWDFMARYYAEGAECDARVRLAGGDRRRREGGGVETKESLRLVAERYAARIPGLSPETLDRRKAAGDDWALIGDAAGFADPVTGEGIYYALRSAELLAEAYGRGDVAAYDRMWREDFGRELRRASEMRRRFYGSFYGAPFTERMIRLAGLHGGVRRTLRELVSGEQGYLGLKRTLARRAFLPF